MDSGKSICSTRYWSLQQRVCSGFTPDSLFISRFEVFTEPRNTKRCRKDKNCFENIHTLQGLFLQCLRKNHFICRLHYVSQFRASQQYIMSEYVKWEAAM